MTTTRKHRARQLSALEIDQRRADMAALTYDDDCACRVCGEHFTDPHADGCPRGDGFNTMSDDAARAIAATRAEHFAGQADDRAAFMAAEEFAAFTLATLAADLVTDDGVTHAWAATRVLTGPFIAERGTRAVFSMVTGELVPLPLADFFEGHTL